MGIHDEGAEDTKGMVGWLTSRVACKSLYPPVSRRALRVFVMKLRNSARGFQAEAKPQNRCMARLAKRVLPKYLT